ncbi:VWA domain-containing protein [Streptomyces triticagri]|uniref:VWA domain-containing protein n=1 Tax=Streptomyces triticagri TaxID=2293568 RepID=A0A372LW42_9ACTN|nr:VWA domain-containing protein [Streptomyces triticagri]RFU82600.1 VWA domain-containing protein [Streptomyces triticagri]
MNGTDPFLPAVDRAAFAAALADRLRHGGVPVGLTATQDLVAALTVARPSTRTALYWTARITLVRDRPYLNRFDEVFAAVFGDALLAVDPHARRDGLGAVPPRGGPAAPLLTDAAGDPIGGTGLPWATLAPTVGAAEHSEDHVLTVPQRLPSDLAGAVDTPFEQLDERESDLLGQYLEAALGEWPTQRSRRYAVRPGGSRVAIRETVARSRRTGWEPVRLVRTAPVRRPRRVVVLCDVSRSMQAQAVPYLHLMRALARATRAETFAFATSLTRLTHVLAHRSAQTAFEEASERVTDRFGGTRIAYCLETLLASHHGGAVRGAVVLIASDGWDGDPPERLAAAMARLHRRAHLITWLNPRAGTPGYVPRTTTMAAALPHIDVLLPATTFNDLVDLGPRLAALRNSPSGV